MKNFYICLLTLFTVNLHSQSYTSTGEKTFYGKEKSLLIKDMIPNIQGGFTAVGSVGSSMDKKDVFLTEFDKSGNIISEKIGILKERDGVANAVVQTPDGGYVLAGYTKEQGKFKAAWIVKLSENKETIWSEEMRNKGDFEFLDLAQDDEGNLTACGYADKSMYIARFTMRGKLIKQKKIAGKKAQRATAIVALDDGVVITGWEKMSNSYSNHLLIRLDRNLNELWNREYWGTKSYDIIRNKSGNLVTISSIPSSRRGYHSTNLAIQIVNKDGDRLLEKSFKLITKNSICKIVQRYNGEYHIVGQFDPVEAAGYYPAPSKNILFNSENISSSFYYHDTRSIIKGYKGSSIIQIHDGNLFLAAHSSKQSLFTKISSQNHLPFYPANLSISSINYHEIQGDNNGVLDSGERGYCDFYLQNKGKNDAYDVILNIGSNQQENSTVSPFFQIHIGHISAGDSKLVQIPIIAKGLPKSANPIIDISIIGADRIEHLLYKFEINSTSKKNIASEPFLDIEWIEPNIINGNHKNVADSTVELELQATSSHPLLERHFTVLVNGKHFNNGRKLNTVRLQLVKEDIDQIQRRYIYKYTVSCRLEIAKNTIEASVQNQAGKAYAPTVVIEVTSNTITTPKSNLYLLSIGVPHYDLQFTTKDAEAIAVAYKKQEGILFDKVVTKVLNTRYDTNADTLRKSISRIFGDMPGGLKKDDLVIVYISSHGFVLKDGSFRIAAQDYDKIDIDNTTLDFHDHIYEDLNRLECNRLVLTDACQEVLDMSDYCPPCVPTPKNGRDIADVMEEYNDILGINSCDSNQFSYEDENWGYGAFTKALLEAFENSSLDKDGDGVLIISELYDFLRKRVPEIVKTKKGLPSSETQVPSMPESQFDSNIPIIGY